MKTKLFTASVLALALGGGCSYNGLAVAKDGTTYVAKNDRLLAGLLNKIYVCKPNGATLTCIPTTTP